jgi:hypothetical protein
MKRLSLGISVTYVLSMMLLVLVCFPAQGFSIDVTPDQISKVAEAGKDFFIGTIALQYYKKYGISEMPKQPVTTLEEGLNPNSSVNMSLKQNPAVVLGTPFQVYTINTADILGQTPIAQLSSVLVPTTQWFVPLFIYNQPRELLTVDYVDGQWTVVGIGLGDISEKVNKTSLMNGSLKFVRIFPGLSDFMVGNVNGQDMMLPFNYIQGALGLDPSLADSAGFYHVSDVMPKLADSVRNNVGGGI